MQRQAGYYVVPLRRLPRWQGRYGDAEKEEEKTLTLSALGKHDAAHGGELAVAQQHRTVSQRCREGWWRALPPIQRRRCTGSFTVVILCVT